MKRQIRRGVFETNSSSVHSLTMCSGEDYKKWKDDKVLYWRDKEEFYAKEDIIEKLKESRWYSGELRYPDVDWSNEEEVSEIFEEEEI